MNPAQPSTLRVLLLQARSDYTRRIGQGIAPPLGLMSIAAAAREKFPGRLYFELLDSYFYTNDEIGRRVRSLKPHVIAISGMTNSYDRMSRLSSVATQQAKDAHIIIGGPHATAYPHECLALPGVKAVAPGEGEIPFTDYLEYLFGKRPLSEVRGILCRSNDDTVEHQMPEPITDIDALPTPAYDLIDVDFYEQVVNSLATIILPPHRYMPLFTSRGCPYGCTFCHRIFGRKYRAQSIERVLDNIEQLSKHYQVNSFHFFDDSFNTRPDQIFDLCKGIMGRKLKVKLYFANGLRADKLDRPQLEAMREAGVVYFGAAIEAASERLQKLTKKNMDIEKLLANVAIADELGIFTTGFLMLGFPDETREEMELTIETAAKSALSYAYFSVLNPYDNTPIGRELKEQGVDISSTNMPAGYSSPGKNFAGIPEAEFQQLVRSAYRAFWTPKRLMMFLARHPEPEGLMQSLLTRETRRNLQRRVRSVLGFDEKIDTQSDAWQKSTMLGGPFIPLARWSGRACNGVARVLRRVW